MKKIFFVILSICILVMIVYNGKTSKELVNDATADETIDNVSSDVLSLPLEIAKTDVDMDGDGENESVRIILLEGEKVEDNKYKGEFEMVLYDIKQNQIDKMIINGNSDLILPKDFPIIFKDYNGDGVLDFNIGYSNPEEEKEYIYHFYTLSREKGLEELNIKNSESIFKSCEKDYSYNFKSTSNNAFITYDYNGEYYEYKVYRWEDEYFMVVNYMHSPLDYKEIDEILIRNKIDQIASSVKLVNEKNILKACEKEYNWFLEHLEEVKVYLFIDRNYEKHQYEVERILSKKIYEQEQINSQFSIFEIDDIRKYSLEEVKRFKSPYGEDDYKYKQYDWKVEDKNYTLLVGGFHLDNFILLFSESGQYLDGYIWTDKVRNSVQVLFRSKQNFVSVSPINKGYGTGISVFGAEWFEVYKGKLVSRFEYPVKGYEAPPYTIGYTREYELIDEKYDQDTGDYQTIYKLGVGFYGLDNEWIGIDGKISYHWNPAKEEFESVDYHNIYEHIAERLFSQDIEDKILEKNYEKLEEIIKEDMNEYKEENMGQLTIFLTRCSESKKRDKLLKELHVWYTKHNDILNSEKFIKMIKEAMP